MIRHINLRVIGGIVIVIIVIVVVVAAIVIIIIIVVVVMAVAIATKSGDAFILIGYFYDAKALPLIPLYQRIDLVIVISALL